MKRILLLSAAVMIALLAIFPARSSAMSVVEFRDAFNRAAGNNGVPELSLRLVQSGNEFKNYFSQYLLMTCFTGSRGNVNKIIVVVEPNDQTEAGRFMTVLGLTISVMNPELSASGRREVLRELKLTPERLAELMNSNGASTRGGVRYTSTYSDGMFGVVVEP